MCDYLYLWSNLKLPQNPKFLITEYFPCIIQYTWFFKSLIIYKYLAVSSTKPLKIFKNRLRTIISHEHLKQLMIISNVSDIDANQVIDVFASTTYYYALTDI